MSRSDRARSSSVSSSTQHVRMRSSSSSILPRISEPSYAPLGGSQDRRERLMHYPWKRIAIGAGCVLGLIWMFSGPAERPIGYAPAVPIVDDSAGVPPSNHDSSWPTQAKPPAPPHYDDDLPAVPPPTSPSSSSKHPTSFETDPNPLSTTYCTHPYSSSSPLVQYALMLDAGSQGSRIHVYKFNYCSASLALEWEVFEQLRPGLSSYAGSPDKAAESLDALMDRAVAVVPKSLHKCTPVAVKATAGLRLLGERQAAEILSAVRSRLVSEYPFELPSISADGLEDRVAIMDGKDEGVYAWITSNYLLRTIGPSAESGHPPYAVLDLGGASTQIVFEPTFGPDAKEVFADGEHKYSLAFAGRTSTLYQHSYLGYGLMRARASVHSLVEWMADMQASNHHSSPPAKSGRSLTSPCISQSTSRKITLDQGQPTEREVTMAGEDIASFASCSKLIELVLAKDSVCSVKPCSFDGTYQPSIVSTFPRGGILALSYFTDRISPFVEAGFIGKHTPSSTDAASTVHISELPLLAQKVCAGPSSWQLHFASSPSVMKDLEGRPETCLDLTFMHGLLRLGYEFGDEREVRLAKKIEGVELGWALGAALALVDAQVSCRV